MISIINYNYYELRWIYAKGQNDSYEDLPLLIFLWIPVNIFRPFHPFTTSPRITGAYLWLILEM